MALNRRVARRYARALGELAHERGQLEQVEADLALVAETLASDSGFRRVWEHQRIGKHDKRRVLEQLFGGRILPLTMNFLFLLLEKRRETILEAITGEFTALANEVRDVVDVEVRTARALSDEEREALSRRMSEYVGKKIRLIEVTSPELLGGVIARVGDLVMDGSVLTRLRRLQERLRVHRWYDDEG